MLVTWFDPPCAPPERMPSPFARAPHPIARHAADHLRARLPAPREGKMFGVLVVADAGRIGYLAAYSGMLDGSWHVPGFVPPAYDEAARAFWPAAEAALDALAAQISAIDPSQHTALAALDAAHAAELAALRERHLARKAARQLARATASDRHALDQESRADTAEKRRVLARHHSEREPLARAVAVVDEQRRVLEQQRADKSRIAMTALFESYRLPNARGEVVVLPSLFAPAAPPGGAGDCCAPKLLAYAHRHALAPIALAEFWWGPPPATGGRHHGVFYPACRGKCGPVLAHMLGGIDHDPHPVFEDANAGGPRIVFEDRWLAIVEKPIGLLSVRGKSTVDSVQTRLAARFGEAYVAHRLDLDVSGLLLVAKDRDTHAALQRLFACREVDKRYIAWLDGYPAHDAGVVELALRVDLDDRPRQVVDPVHGKPALTEWRVLERSENRTKVALYPRTGRAHQLRVHAAHPEGIGVPIVGDALYGREAARLHLHADHLAFVHPHTKTRVEVAWPAPF